jgi:hypothetical protein
MTPKMTARAASRCFPTQAVTLLCRALLKTVSIKVPVGVTRHVVELLTTSRPCAVNKLKKTLINSRRESALKLLEGACHQDEKMAETTNIFPKKVRHENIPKAPDVACPICLVFDFHS